MKINKMMFVSFLGAVLVGSLAGASVASTAGVYIDDQFDSGLNSSEWVNVSTGGGTSTVADGILTVKANGYGNSGAVMSVDALHPDADQTVVLTANFATSTTWDWEKIFGFGVGDLWASGGGVYLFKNADKQWVMTMKDGANAAQTYYVPKATSGPTEGWCNAWSDNVGPTRLSWSNSKVTWEKWDSVEGWGTVFDSSTMGPLETGTWRIPTADAKVLANTWVNSFQLNIDSMKLEVMDAPAVPEPSSLLALGCGLTGIAAAIRRRK